MAEVIRTSPIVRNVRLSPAALDAWRKKRSAPSAPVAPPAPAGMVATIPAIAPPVKKLKVAAYCRVSTLMDSQETSIDAQREHFEQEIKSNPEWEFAGTYLEAGLSGTKAESRPELQRLLADCRAGKVDYILTKSISRFARNTSDCLEMVRTLTALNIPIHFSKENIDTGSMESEFMLSILACLAEDESHSISGNMRWSIQKRFQSGTYKQATAPYGYIHDPQGSLVIEPVAAEVVKRIFSSVLKGSGADTIAKTLNEEHIPGPTGGRWSSKTVRNIVANPAYKGDMLYQKTYTDERFVRRTNTGQRDKFYDAGHHQPIVSAEDFDSAQDALRQRALEVGYTPGTDRCRSQRRYVFTGILTCKACGCTMHRQPRASGGPAWICGRHTNHPDLCKMLPQSDNDLKRAFINCLNKLAWSNRYMTPSVLDLFEAAQQPTVDHAVRLAEIDQLLEANTREKQKLTAIIMRDHFLPVHRVKHSALLTEAAALMDEKNRILSEAASGTPILALRSFVAGWKITDDPEAFPEEAFTSLVESCIVNSQKMVEFKFRCGLTLTESLYQVELSNSTPDRKETKR